MKKKKIGILIASGLILVVLLIFGLQDKEDPFWEELDTLLITDFKTLDKSGPELQKLYEKAHSKVPNEAQSALELISDPFLPIMEYEKFDRHFNRIYQNRFAIFSGATGTGATTLIESIAKLIAPKEENKMSIICAPQFDLSLHREYIGENTLDGFREGRLLQFWKKCKSTPNENFLLIIDDFDKISPETFFGPELWRKLDDPDFEVIKNGQEIEIPSNFYMIMSTHSGEGTRIELNNEHFRRLGGKTEIVPEFKELIVYLQIQKQSVSEHLKNDELSPTEKMELKNVLAALNNVHNLKRHVYSFQRINDLIADKYSKDFQIGQWNTVRKLYKEDDFNEMKQIFANHVNALSKDRDMTLKDLAPIEYTIRTNGKVKGSNSIASGLRYLEEKGFLTEFLVGLSFMLITALFSWYLFRKKLRFVNIYTQRVYELINAFENGKQNYETVSRSFVEIKREVDDLVLKRDINYTEAVFFYNFIEDRTNRIEIARSVHESFNTLVETFLDDDRLEEREYQKLNQFIENIRHRISRSDYAQYKERIKELYERYH